MKITIRRFRSRVHIGNPGLELTQRRLASHARAELPAPYASQTRWSVALPCRTPRCKDPPPRELGPKDPATPSAYSLLAVRSDAVHDRMRVPLLRIWLASLQLGTFGRPGQADYLRLARPLNPNEEGGMVPRRCSRLPARDFRYPDSRQPDPAHF
jgi:hypothetical protein